MLDITVRKAGGNDMAFVAGTWVNSFTGSLSWLPISHARDEIRRRVNALERRGAQFYVASNTSDEDHLYGFVCVKNGVLHYAYTKEFYRRAHVMTRLLRGLVDYPVKCSHFTYKLEELEAKNPGRFVYSPRAAEHWRKK